MDTADEQAVRPIPGFRPSRALLLDPPPEGMTIPPAPAGSPAPTPPGTGSPTEAAADPDNGGGLYGRPHLSPERSGTRTATSDSTGDGPKPPTLKDTAVLVAGVLGLVVAGAAFLVRMRRGAKLRRPTVEQLDDIAKPLAGLAMRHVPAGLLNRDLADIIAAGAATGAYLNDGPLLEIDYPDSGVPKDLQEDPS